MKIRILPHVTCLAALALAGCATTVADVPQPYVEQLPAPLAEPGEPQITSRGSGLDDEKVYFQHFDDAAVVEVASPGGTIAYRHRLFAGRTEAIPAQQIAARCNIDDLGEVRLSSCMPHVELGPEQGIAMALARLSSDPIALPTYRPLPEGYANLYRTAAITLAVPEIPAPKVDLTSGRLVEFAEIDIDAARIAQSYSYPARALRMELEGNLVAECQIQQDRSTICTMTSFDPPEHAGIFAPALDQIVRRLRPGDMLKDGTDARGVRFPLKLAFRIPN